MPDKEEEIVSTTTEAPVKKSGFRPDLEGVRAIAVLLVVFYHAGVSFLPGGYVGVDVFYVLSGFFITGLLLKEAEKSGRISFRDFYARRGRRLLPAATFVIVVTAVASWFVYPPLRQPSIGWDALTSAFNVANFRYAVESTDYLNAGQAPSPYLHFWSLAVEEQFYWVWPLLFAAFLGILFARKAINPVRLAWGLGVMTVLSFAACVWLTSANQPWAFFMLPTRMWELGVGALLAVFAAAVLRIAGAVKDALTILGLAMIIAAAVWFNDATAFPGYAAALPVLGTALVIAGSRVPASGPGVLLASRPMRAMGRWSYSIYLWHWPLLIIPAVWLGEGLSAPVALGLGLASIALGAASYRFVENPIRLNPKLSASAAKSLLLSGVLVLVGAAAGAVLIFFPKAVASGGEVAPVTPSDMTESLQAALVEGLGTQVLPSNLTPSLSVVKDDLPDSYAGGCHLDFSGTTYGECLYGDKNGSQTVMLLGDSHAAQWLPGLDLLGKENGWKVISLTKSACPNTTVIADHPTDAGRSYSECADAHDAMLARVGEAKPDLVVLSSLVSVNPKWTGAERDAWIAGAAEFTEQVKASGAKAISWLGDTPRPAVNVPECVSANSSDIPACVTSFKDAVRLDNEEGMSQSVIAAGATYIPTYDWLCTGEACPVIVGNILVYRDDSHLTTAMSRWLAPELQAALNLP